MIGQSQNNQFQQSADAAQFPEQLTVPEHFSANQDTAADNGNHQVISRQRWNGIQQVSCQKNTGADLMNRPDDHGKNNHPVGPVCNLPHPNLGILRCCHGLFPIFKITDLLIDVSATDLGLKTIENQKSSI